MSDVTIDILDTIAAVQEGDHETISTILSAKIISPNAKDANGCTLLHWAAINNRITVATLLIEYGANSVGGGMLDESPLHWCLRKRYYRMARLLVEKLHVDLRHKSAQGLDALHLCCRLSMALSLLLSLLLVVLEDLFGVFLILSWGANPNSTDDDGNTPLLWLAKHGNISTDGDLFRLLIRFGARVDCQDPISKDSIFHLFARSEIHDLSLLFFLYQPGRAVIPFMVNNAGITPYSQSMLSENRTLAGFLFDVLFFNSFPFWSPAWITAGFVLVTLLVLHLWGCLTALVFATVALVPLFYFAWQPRIVDHFSRVYVGLFYGLLVAAVVHFFWSLRPLLSVLTAGLTLTLLGSLLYLASLSTSKPVAATSSSVKDLADRIADSAPSEGTDEENEASRQREWSSRHVKVIRDSFTGKIQAVNVNELDALNGQRGRVPGPSLCCSCLTDQDFETDASFKSVHCSFCNACVMAADHHSQILGVCIGIGNRRMFVGFLWLGSLASASYLLCSKWIQYSILCPSQSLWLLDSEWCLFQRERVSCLLQVVSFFFFIWSSYLFFLELQAVSLEDTLLHKASSKSHPPLPLKRRLLNVVNFLRTGSYGVLPHLKDKSGSIRSHSNEAVHYNHHDDGDSCGDSVGSRSSEEDEEDDAESGLLKPFGSNRNRR